jgi:hypothetical protein
VKTGEYLACYDLNKEFTVKLVNTFFIRGTLGLEITNYYADFPTPSVGKKIGLIEGRIFNVFPKVPR